MFLMTFIIESLLSIKHVLDTKGKKTAIPILVELTIVLVDIKLLGVRTCPQCLTLIDTHWVMNKYPLT